MAGIQDDLLPNSTPGLNLGARKTAEEYGDLDAEDEILARWKASLGLSAARASGADLSEPKVTVLGLELTSPSLPKGKSIKLDFSSEEKRKYYENNPIQVKEGAPYKTTLNRTRVPVTFK